MALTQVREPPHIAQPHAEAHAGEQILGFVIPFGPVAHLLLLHPLQVGVRGDPLIQTRVWDLEWKVHHAGVWRASETGLCGCWAGLGWLGLLRARKEDGSSLWQPPLAVSFTPAVRPWRGAETFTLTYGTAVISRSLQSVVYYVMSAILGRCDHLEMVNKLHMMPLFVPPFTSCLQQFCLSCCYSGIRNGLYLQWKTINKDKNPKLVLAVISQHCSSSNKDITDAPWWGLIIAYLSCQATPFPGLESSFFYCVTMISSILRTFHPWRGSCKYAA